MVDPSGAVAIDTAINDVLFVDVKVKGVIGLQWVMGVTILGFLPSNHVPFVFNDHLTFGNVDQRKDALAVHARASGLDPMRSFLGLGWCRQGRSSIK